MISIKQNDMLSEKEVSAELKKLAPHFALVVFDCYNRPANPKDKIFKKNLVQLKLSPKKNLPGLKTLFLKNTGLLTLCSGFPVTSCLYANRTSAKGGYFTNNFLLALYSHAKLKNAGWNLVRVLSSLEGFGLSRPLINSEITYPPHRPIPRLSRSM